MKKLWQQGGTDPTETKWERGLSLQEWWEKTQTINIAMEKNNLNWKIKGTEAIFS